MTSTEDNRLQTNRCGVRTSSSRIPSIISTTTFLPDLSAFSLFKKTIACVQKSRYSLVHTNITDFNTALNANSRCDLDLIQWESLFISQTLWQIYTIYLLTDIYQNIYRVGQKK